MGSPKKSAAKAHFQSTRSALSSSALNNLRGGILTKWWGTWDASRRGRIQNIPSFFRRPKRRRKNRPLFIGNSHRRRYTGGPHSLSAHRGEEYIGGQNTTPPDVHTLSDDADISSHHPLLGVLPLTCAKLFGSKRLAAYKISAARRAVRHQKCSPHKNSMHGAVTYKNPPFGGTTQGGAL